VIFMANKILRDNILQVVDNQLRDDKPLCTKQTFERLLKAGYSAKRAKEMIATVLIEEMFDIMKQNESFNEERFCERLNVLS